AVELMFNFRFSTASTVETLKQRLEGVLKRHGLEYDIVWTSPHAAPFITPEGDLVKIVGDAIRAVTGVETELSTTGGTSDGRFIATICKQLVEFGPVNESIHKLNEHIKLTDVVPLGEVYRRVLESLLAPKSTAGA